MDQYLRLIWLVPLGLFTGAFGTLIGAGGGFALVPLLLWLYPTEAPETITSISLAVVFFNALSASLAYARTKRIDYKSAIIFSIAAVPGAVFGAFTTTFIPRRKFDALFGILMIFVSALLFLRPGKKGPGLATSVGSLAQSKTNEPSFSGVSPDKLLLGAGLSSALGYLSSLLGIGAGFIYVPALVYGLNFPVQNATATSLFILMIMAFTGSATHVFAGLFEHGIRRTIALTIGVVIGAQLGVRLSHHVHGSWIFRGLAVALGFVGARLLFMAGGVEF